MPELPEVETIRRGLLSLEKQSLKNIILRRPDLRWPISPELSKLKNKCLETITRRGKYLLFHFDTGVILVHLGMSGRLFFANESPIEKHDHIDFVFTKHVIRFRDPRRFGSVLWTSDPEHHPLLNHLGPEPLTTDFTFQYLKSAAQRSKRPIKLWLMDADVVVGVGNIYANEVLYLAKVHPMRSPATLTDTELKNIHREIRSVLKAAIKQGGTTLKDFYNSEGEAGYFQQTLHVYGRGGAPCISCKKTLVEIKLSGRTTVFCGNCQL